MEYALRALWFASLLVVAARLLNRATLVSKTPYNFAVNVTFGTLAGAATLQGTRPIWDGTAAIAALTFFAWAANLLSARSSRIRTLLAGSPVPLIRGGRVDHARLRSLRMTEDDLRMQLRQMRVASVGDVELASMEPDGKIGVVLREGAQDRP